MDDKDDDPKQPPRKIPDLNLLEQSNSEFALAASQAESRFEAASVGPEGLSTIESEGENIREGENDDDDEHEESESDGNDYEYFGSNEFDDEFDDDDEFLDEQENNQDLEGDEDDFMEDDEIDPDELSYEELIALGEFIGVEKRGLTPNEVAKCIYESKYVSSQIKNAIDRCVVCQVEYEEDESLVVLRPCEHSFHSECITKWLQIKKICPICSTEASPAKPDKNHL